MSDFKNPVTVGIGITTTIGYGTLYYSIAVFAPIVSKDFEIGLDTFFAIFAIGLLIGGVLAPLIGAHIDKFGARNIMATGSCVAASALLFLSIAPNVWWFSAGVIVLEIAGAMVLYEAAFAGLTQIYGQDARRHITSVTLIAGFASTIFWPLTQYLVAEFDWRTTCQVFALVHILIALPVTFKSLSKATVSKSKPPDNPTIAEEIILQGNSRKRAIVLFTFAIAVSGIAMSVIPVHMLIILQGEGISANTAALVAMVVGPFQVAARLIEMIASERYSPMATGRVCLMALPLALLVLVLPSGAIWSAIAYASLFGISHGLANIVRGAVPLYLFGAKGYGALVGKITAIRFILNAGSPVAFAYLVTNFSLDIALWFVFALAAISAIAFIIIKGPEGQN